MACALALLPALLLVAAPGTAFADGDQPSSQPPVTEPPPPVPPDPGLPAVPDVPVVPQAVSEMKSKAYPVRKVCSTREYVRTGPGGAPTGVIDRGRKVKIARYARGGSWAYAIGRQATGWLRSSKLC